MVVVLEIVWKFGIFLGLDYVCCRQGCDLRSIQIKTDNTFNVFQIEKWKVTKAITYQLSQGCIHMELLFLVIAIWL
jgi:hypothetical protein